MTIKYLRYNAHSLSSPTWMHIASGKPFQLLPGRFGRWSTTACGKEYEMDDTLTVKDESDALAHLCKKCAKAGNIKHQR